VHSDAGVPQAHAGVNLSDAGAPLTDANVDVNQGVENKRDPESEVWDSDKGLKPAQSDSDALDDDVEVIDFLSEGEEDGMVIHSVMTNMVIELEDDDTRDFEWLPPKERKRTVPKKIGMITFTALGVRKLTMCLRKAKGTLSWP
jgi:hypothetical protein